MALAGRRGRRDRRARRGAAGTAPARGAARRGRGAGAGAGEVISRVARVAIVVGLLGLVVVLALAFRRDPHDIRTGTVGKPAPSFALARLDGAGDLALSQYAGKVIVLNFFASWCLPCKQENPALVRVYERYRGSDVVIVGVLYQDSLDAGRTYVRDMGVVWPTVVDHAGRVALSYGVFGIP